MVEICPSIGPFVETARAHLRAHPVPTFTGEIMSEENLQLPLSATIVPLAAAVSALRAQAAPRWHAAALTRRRRVRWGFGLTTGVTCNWSWRGRPASRASLRQDDLDGEAMDESKLTLDMLDVVRPLAEKVATGEMTAEQVIKALSKLPNPNQACATFAILASGQHHFDVNGEEIYVSATSAGKTLELPAQKAYSLTLSVREIYSEKGKVSCRLMGSKEDVSGIFLTEDIGKRDLHFLVGEEFFFLLSQINSLGLAFDAKVALTVGIGRTGRLYTGELIAFVNQKALAADLARLTQERFARL
jgi:hypothetical protein